MLAVLGHFRMPVERLAKARPMMQAVIAATLTEPGCLAYSYAEDVVEPGLIRVAERWESRAHLVAHFASPHMTQWKDERATLGLFDREITLHDLGEGEAV